MEQGIWKPFVPADVVFVASCADGHPLFCVQPLVRPYAVRIVAIRALCSALFCVRGILIYAIEGFMTFYTCFVIYLFLRYMAIGAFYAFFAMLGFFVSLYRRNLGYEYRAVGGNFVTEPPVDVYGGAVEQSSFDVTGVAIRGFSHDRMDITFIAVSFFNIVCIFEMFIEIGLQIVPFRSVYKFVAVEIDNLSFDCIAFSNFDVCLYSALFCFSVAGKTAKGAHMFLFGG